MTKLREQFNQDVEDFKKNFSTKSQEVGVSKYGNIFLEESKVYGDFATSG